MPDSSHQTWLAVLDPEVRLLAEAEIAFYDNEDLWEWEVVDDDWKPDLKGGMGLIVDFNADEVRVMIEAFGCDADFASMMKEMLIGRLQAGFRNSAGPTSASAATSGVGDA